MSSKRKHKSLAIKDKIDILKRIDRGENMYKLAKEYGIGRTTIHDLKKNKEKIMNQVGAMKSGLGQRKTFKHGACPKMETALYTWFKQERSKHISVTGELLREKAIEFYKNITRKDDFRASTGWLDRFKKRFGIRLSAVSGEKLTSDELVSDENLLALCEESAVQSFNIKQTDSYTTEKKSKEKEPTTNILEDLLTEIASSSHSPVEQVKRRKNSPKPEEPRNQHQQSNLDEYDIYGQYVASELRATNNDHGILMAKSYINKILIDLRLGKFNKKVRTNRNFEVIETYRQTSEQSSEEEVYDYIKTEETNNLDFESE